MVGADERTVTVQHLNWSVGACGLSSGQMDPSLWLSSTTFLHYHKEMTAAVDHKNIRHDLLRTDSIRAMVQGDLLFNNPQHCRAYELLERIVRLGVPCEALAQLGSPLKPFVQREGRNEWEDWVWTVSNANAFPVGQQSSVASTGATPVANAGAKKSAARTKRKKAKSKKKGRKK